jgi:hypothetical protein
MFIGIIKTHFVMLAVCVQLSALLGGLLEAQTYSRIYPPDVSFDVQFACKNPWGIPAPNAAFVLYPGKFTHTNGHFHTDPSHPQSSFNPTQGHADGTGWLTVNFSPTLIGQAEYVDVLCIAPEGGNLTRYEWAVGYSDLYYNDHQDDYWGFWLRTGGTDTGANTGHGSTHYNRYMTWTAANGLFDATILYLGLSGGQTRICVNDMALPFGGKFDINALQGGQWQSPHSRHDRGTAADVSGPGASQCPDEYEVNVAAFVEACREHDGDWSLNEGNHAHCDWGNPASYPH